jgi:hypothetical protein
MPMISQLLNTSGACSKGVPPGLAMTLMDLPWGPPVSLLLGLFNLVVTPAFNFGADQPLAARFPVPEFIGALLQSFILCQALGFQFKYTDPEYQGWMCGFLLFNTLGLCGAVTSALSSIIATLSAVARGIDAEAESSDWAVVHLALTLRFRAASPSSQ